MELERCTKDGEGGVLVLRKRFSIHGPRLNAQDDAEIKGTGHWAEFGANQNSKAADRLTTRTATQAPTPVRHPNSGFVW